jgi:dihydroxyacetone kinase-like protein
VVNEGAGGDPFPRRVEGGRVGSARPIVVAPGKESTVKKLINDPEQVVAETLAGFQAAHADLITVYTDPDYVVRADAPVQGKVGLVSGGGSGHEPLHAGYVGLGMLDAAVPGAVFTSPTPDPILEATKKVDGGAGVLHIVKNYTGDVLNFETAAELAEMEDITVKAIVVNDDVAVEDSTWTAGRRGVAGTVLVEKIAGAAAQRGDDLDGVLAIAEKVNSQVRSMGVALTACTVPHAGKPSFDLPEDEIEIGIGIHGEPGRHRIPLEPADAITDRLVDAILADREWSGKVLLFVNGIAVHRLQPRSQAPGGGRTGGDPLAGRQLHHLAGDAGLLDHRAATRRRTHRAVRRTGTYRRIAARCVRMAA